MLAVDHSDLTFYCTTHDLHSPQACLLNLPKIQRLLLKEKKNAIIFLFNLLPFMKPRPIYWIFWTWKKSKYGASSKAGRFYFWAKRWMEDNPFFPSHVFSNSPFLPLFSCILVNKMHGSLGRKLNFHLLVCLKYVCKPHRMGRKRCCRLGTKPLLNLACLNPFILLQRLRVDWVSQLRYVF